MTAFKDAIDRSAVQTLADAIGLPPAFVDHASAGLDALELKDRVRHVARALRAALPDAWPAAIDRLLASLPPPVDGTTGLTAHFAWWPVLQVVEDHGPADPATSLPALRRMTGVFSAEFAVRPYLRHDPAGALAVLRGWLDDDSPHVRRLVSEGTRPRLPWGGRLPAFQREPSWTTPLLDALYRDPEEYVRRSVANHLGDIAKDHVDHAVATALRWLDAPDAHTDRVVRHALRHPIKQGHPGVLQVIGIGPLRDVAVTLTVTPTALTLGGDLQVHATVRSSHPEAQELLIDLALHLRKKDGSLRPKVFKWTRRTLAAGGTLTLAKRLPVRAVSTRRYYDGPQALGVLVNGTEAARAPFTLTL